MSCHTGGYMQIKNRWTNAVIFESPHETMRETVIAAVKAGANLTGADLSGADLSGAYLSGANLTGADLSWADLSWAKGGIITASVQWTAHGECGRQLLAVHLPAFAADGDRPARDASLLYHCGCFHGNEAELRAYIANGAESYRKSRTLAVDFCAARMAEMLDHNTAGM